jgi:hypothetical protein
LPQVINDVEDRLGGLKSRLKENKKERETETDRQRETERERERGERNRNKRNNKILTSKYCCTNPREAPT